MNKIIISTGDTMTVVAEKVFRQAITDQLPDPRQPVIVLPKGCTLVAVVEVDVDDQDDDFRI